MSDIPVVEGKRTTYENFVADCPTCGRESVFNRASDLGTFELIAGRDVSCLESTCGEPFRIVGDSINDAYEMLIYDCYELRDRKHYMSCILNLAQAYELFFGLFFRVELLYKPFAADSSQNLADLNRVAENLDAKIKNYAFARMKALFLQHAVARKSPKSVAEAATVVAGLPCHPGVPKNADIGALEDPKLVPLLKDIKNTTIDTLRNQVVHKAAYRPTRQEVEEALAEARSILFPLGTYFNLHDETSRYSRTT